MKIITRYIILEFMKPLFFSATAFGGLVMISEFFRELNFYLEKKAAFGMVLLYLFYNLPWWIIQVLPVAVLLAILFSLGGLAKRGEITAFKSAGINLWRIIGIFSISGLLIGAADILLREKVIPCAVEQAEKIRIEKILKQERRLRKTKYSNLVVSLPNNRRMTIAHADAEKGNLWQLVLDFYNDKFHLNKQIVAETATWQQGSWLLKNGVIRVFKEGSFKEDKFLQKTMSLPFKPEDFILVRLRPEQMTSRDFKKYINQLRTLGIPHRKELIRLYSRWSMVFSHVIVMMIGIPFALGMGSRHGKIISFTFALIFAFLYWGIQAVGQTLGESKVISPLLAAWLGNIVFGAIGLGLLCRVRK